MTNLKNDLSQIAVARRHEVIDIIHLEKWLSRQTTFVKSAKASLGDDFIKCYTKIINDQLADQRKISDAIGIYQPRFSKDLTSILDDDIGPDLVSKEALPIEEDDKKMLAILAALLNNDWINSILLSIVNESNINSLMDGVMSNLKPVNGAKLIGVAKGNIFMPNGDFSEAEEFNWKDYCECLNDTAKSCSKPFIGREDIIDRTIQVLSRMDKSNPCLVGEPGVGKTAIVLGLADKINKGEVPSQIKDCTIYSVDLTGIVAGTQYRGEFEKRIKALLEGAKSEGNCILFFDEMHTMIGAGSSRGSLDASNILKPYLTSGNIKFIGATTYKEFKIIENDSALMRRFHKIDITEPTRDEAIEIINGLIPEYEKYHGVKYTDNAVVTTVDLTIKHVHERFLPDKAIDIIDEAGAYISTHPTDNMLIDEDVVRKTISRLHKIPVETITKDEFKAVRELDVNLKTKIFGQDNAINEIVAAIKLSKSGLGDEEKPIGSFLFVGPTGTGKTATAKALANELGVELIRFDMSEYSERTSISKLIGTSAGYVGYEDGGLLVEAIRKNPNCVLLLDEIEKADPEIFKCFLQVMDYGTLKDNKGRIADFRNAVIIMTSNAGTHFVTNALGFGSNNNSHHANQILEGVKKTFTPEFRNRLSAIVQFNSISDDIGRKVAEKELETLTNKLKAKGISVTYSDACINELVAKGVSPDYGAREIQRLINTKIKSLFIDLIINGTKQKNFIVDYKDGCFVYSLYKPLSINKRKASVKAI